MSLTSPLQSQATAAFHHLIQAAPVVVLDHSRAGNFFFMCLFDRHPEVLVVPHVGYLPFHLARFFNRRETVTGKEAFEFLMTRTDFRYVAQDMSDDIAREYLRLGSDPGFSIERPLVRATLRELLGSGCQWRKADLVSAMHAAYALGTGRDISRVKYLLMNDSPIHYRAHFFMNIQAAYAAYHKDFRRCVFIHLVRDPRATFASMRHQTIRQNNGMYSFTWRGLAGALRSIFFGGVGWCVYAHILACTATGSRDLFEWRKSSRDFYVVRNEDINLRFGDTMQTLCRLLGISWFPAWSDPGYVPTCGGRTWKGVGAYNESYQRLTLEKIRGNTGLQRGTDHISYRFKTDKSLENDPQALSFSIAGPNRYVTERWRSRLTSHETALVEAIHYKEMLELGYETLYVHGDGLGRWKGFIRCVIPLPGEMLSSLWIINSMKSGFLPSLKLLFELISLPVYYFCSRAALLRLYLLGRLDAR